MTRPSSFSSWTSTRWCPSGPERNRLEVSEPHAGRDSPRREAVRLRAREEQIYRCYSFSKGPFAPCGFSRLIMTLTVLGRDFRRHDERIAGLPGLNARIMKEKRGEVKEECGEVGGRAEGRASAAATRKLQEQRSFYLRGNVRPLASGSTQRLCEPGAVRQKGGPTRKSPTRQTSRRAAAFQN